MKRSLAILFAGFVLMLFFQSHVAAAEKVRLRQADTLLAQMQATKSPAPIDLAAQMGLGVNEKLKIIRSNTDRNRVTHTRYAQLFNGVPVWGYQVIVSTDSGGAVVGLHGTMIEDIAVDIPETRLRGTVNNEKIALAKTKEALQKDHPDIQKWTIENEQSELVVWLDHSDTAHLSYRVSFLAAGDNGTVVTRPVIFLDAGTLREQHRYEGLTRADASGPGGNEKIGRYVYGADYPLLEVMQDDDTCHMINDKVKTVNLNHDTFGNTEFTFECFENTYKSVNGAFSPLNDAHYFGGRVFDMYNEWFGAAPLPFQLVNKVHYGYEHTNAYWTGTSAIFGDGADEYYPMVSLDIVGHEVGHGVTEMNSNLIYENQSGAINESFSDMAGEAVEFYTRGSNDFLIAADVYKGDGALRHMEDPTVDRCVFGQNAIDHVDQYWNGMDVHCSSGIFNKAFYLLTHRPGWNIRKAFEIFFKANRDYWEAGSTFTGAAEDVRDAALDLGYSADDVREAFAAVGIAVDGDPDPEVIEIQNGETVSGLSATRGQSLDYFIRVPDNATRLTIEISDGTGDADLYTQFGRQPAGNDFECRPYRYGNNETCVTASPAAGQWFIRLTGYADFSGVRLTAGFD